MKALTFSELPQTKLRLKKAILKGEIKVYECNYDIDNTYRLLENVSSLINLWGGFHYDVKYQNPDNIGSACLGTSFYYKFSK